MGNKSWAIKARFLIPVAGISKRGVLFVLISGHRRNNKI